MTLPPPLQLQHTQQHEKIFTDLHLLSLPKLDRPVITAAALSRPTRLPARASVRVWVRVPARAPVRMRGLLVPVMQLYEVLVLGEAALVEVIG